jgi:hypothetical protein
MRIATGEETEDLGADDDFKLKHYPRARSALGHR